MKFIKILLLLVFIFILTNIFLYSTELKFPDITTTTEFTQDLDFSNPGIVIYTESEIKSLHCTSVPELLSKLFGLQVLKVNESTYELSIYGLASYIKQPPIILVNGMEISENMYNRVYLMNLPISIDDIDRIEVIYDPTISSNGYRNVSGIINTVTKSPFSFSEYFSTMFGSKHMFSSSISKIFVYNNWITKVSIKKSSKNQSSIKQNRNFSIFLDSEKVTQKHKYQISMFLGKHTTSFTETFTTFPRYFRPIRVTFKNSIPHVYMFGSLFNYKSINSDFSIYFQTYRGSMKGVRSPDPVSIQNLDLISDIFKITWKKKIIHNELLNIDIGDSFYRKYSKITETTNEHWFENNLYSLTKVFLPYDIMLTNYLVLQSVSKQPTKLSFSFGINKKFKYISAYLGFSYYVQTQLPIYRNIDLKTYIANERNSNLPFPILQIIYKGDLDLTPQTYKQYQFSLYNETLKNKYIVSLYYRRIYNFPAVRSDTLTLENFVPTVRPYPDPSVSFKVYGLSFLIWKNFKKSTVFFQSDLSNMKHNKRKTKVIKYRTFISGIRFPTFFKTESIIHLTYRSKSKFCNLVSKERKTIDFKTVKHINKKKLDISVGINDILGYKYTDIPWGSKQGRQLFIKITKKF